MPQYKGFDPMVKLEVLDKVAGFAAQVAGRSEKVEEFYHMTGEVWGKVRQKLIIFGYDVLHNQNDFTNGLTITDSLGRISVYRPSCETVN